MKKFVTIIAIIVTLLTPARADALPVAWRNSRVVTKGAITYRVKGHTAVVIRVRRNATIPAEIKKGGRWYEVRAIWPNSIAKRVTKLTIHADLECCEDGRLWSLKRVTVTRKGMYRWLKRTGANVTRIHCPYCK